MLVVRVVLLVLAGVLTALIVRALMADASFLESFGSIMAHPWGLVALVDLYLGFVVAASVISLAERTGPALCWIVAIFLLGNVVTALWAAWRLPQLARAVHAASLSRRS